MHPAELERDELLRQCEVRRQRRSGPGGQHRNKVETGVFLVHGETGIRAEATERRSQQENLSLAAARLRVNLALAVRGGRAVDAGPSPRWKARAAGQRITVSTEHEDFPALVAEALDAIHACEFDVSAAAGQLQVSSSQLVRLLKQDPRALAQVNDQRQRRGLRALR
jgi:hypothetical protein